MRTRDILEWVNDSLSAVFAELPFDATVMKGWPDFARPALRLPTVAIELAGIEVPSYGRVGDALSIAPLTWRITVFATSEQEMVDLADALLTWYRDNESPVLTALNVTGADANLTISFTGAARYESSNDVAVERHGMMFQFVITRT